MSTPTAAAARQAHSAQPRLDGSAPLLKAVVREVAVEPGKPVVRQGEAPRAARLLLEGQMCRYRLMANGRRQITAILVPGDLCDLGAVMRGRADYFVEAFAPSVLGEIPADCVDGLDEPGLDIRRALWRELLREDAIAREWIVMLGRRSAVERVAHLICEIRERMLSVGLGEHDSYKLHLTHADLADAVGLSIVHTNRVVQQLRAKDLVEIKSPTVRVIDPAALADLAGFDPTYLGPT